MEGCEEVGSLKMVVNVVSTIGSLPPFSPW